MFAAIGEPCGVVEVAATGRVHTSDLAISTQVTAPRLVVGDFLTIDVGLQLFLERPKEWLWESLATLPNVYQLLDFALQ